MNARVMTKSAKVQCTGDDPQCAQCEQEEKGVNSKCAELTTKFNALMMIRSAILQCAQCEQEEKEVNSTDLTIVLTKVQCTGDDP